MVRVRPRKVFAVSLLGIFLVLVMLAQSEMVAFAAPGPAGVNGGSVPSRLGPLLGSIGSHWTSVGPSPITNCFFGGTCSGRVTAIAYDPTDPTGQTVYVGGAQGGVWKTRDGGSTWAAVMDNPVRPDGTSLSDFTIAVGSIAVDSSGVVYVGTGEPNCDFDCQYGAGVLRSADGGATWTQLGLEQFWRQEIAAVAINPANQKQLMVGATNGFWTSSDGGNTWSISSLVTGRVTDVVFDPSKPFNGIVYAAAHGSIYQSTDMGATWHVLSGGLPTDVSRIALAASASSPGTVVAALANHLGFSGSQIWKTMDSGTSWSQITSAPDICGGQCSYDLFAAIDPTNAQTLYLGGRDAYRSTNGGGMWTDIGGYSGFIHPDQHAFAFNPTNPNSILIGNDGGVWSSSDQGRTWSSLNQGLSLTQFYSITTSPGNSETFLGGTQDNGVLLRTDSSMVWSQVDGGDGGWTGFDPSNAQTVYHLGNTGVRRSDTGGVSWITADSHPLTDYTVDFISFLQPMAFDTSSPSTLYLGTYRLWKTNDRADPLTGPWYTPIPGLDLSTIPDCLVSGRVCGISTLAVSPSNSQVVYGATNTGKFFASSNAGISFTEKDTGLPFGFISKIAVDPTNSAKVVVVLRAFGHNVFVTADGGNTWTDISGSLSPRVPAYSVVVDRLGTIYVGTDAGVFVTFDEGATWRPLGTGLPHVQVRDLAFSAGRVALVAATLGRGVWTIPPLTLAQEISSIKEEVNDLLASGALNVGQAGSLMSKLDRAISDLNNGNDSLACNRLQSFVNEVNALVADGILTQAQANPLLDGASAIMHAIPC